MAIHDKLPPHEAMPVCNVHLGRKAGVAVCLQNGMPWMTLLICECPFGVHAWIKRITLEHASMYVARDKLAQASCSSEARKPVLVPITRQDWGIQSAR